MSRTAINEILDRSLLDEDFRRAINSDPDAVLAEYDLTEGERAALASRNCVQATTLAGLPAIGAMVNTVNIAVNVIITTIVYLNTTNNLIAIRPDFDEERRSQLQEHGAEIARGEGDRTDRIKELLAEMR